jgi:hypothetical protein
MSLSLILYKICLMLKDSIFKNVTKKCIFKLENPMQSKTFKTMGAILPSTKEHNNNMLGKNW